jgi:DNA-binding MarR family transcriptional regulator
VQSHFDRRSVKIHLTDPGREAMDTILAAGVF